MERFVPSTWYIKTKQLMQNFEHSIFANIPRINITKFNSNEDKETDELKNKSNNVDDDSAENENRYIGKGKGKNSNRNAKSSTEP